MRLKEVVKYVLRPLFPVESFRQQPAGFADDAMCVDGMLARAPSFFHRIKDDFVRYSLGWAMYFAAFFSFLALALSGAPVTAVDHFIWPLGLVATWRYGWQLTHFLRAEHYKRTVFPFWRAKAERIAKDPTIPPAHLGVVVTSYQMSAQDNYEVYAKLFHELIVYGAPVTIVASVTDDGDARLVHQIFQSFEPPEYIQLLTQRQAGTGKRDAMAAALRALQMIVEPDHSVLILMDGDTVVTPGLFAKVCPFFIMMPDLAALTVNNSAEVRGGEVARVWYSMRFALRTLYMNSLSLSRRVLCLTGRFSVFRGEVGLSDAFINRLQNDHFDHWRLGKVKMLTGDDKSTWYHCLKGGWAMIYLPDTYVLCLEELPGGGFMKASAKLMQRWFGNMLRNSDRSIALGPRRMGGFTWWCLVDQRISMWTSLSGAVFLIYFLAQGKIVALPAYLCLVLTTRFIQMLNVSYQGGPASPFVPFLLLHQQFVGSFIKVQTMFHLDRQKWTRQNIATGTVSAEQRAASAYGDRFKAMVIMIFIALMLALIAATSKQ